MKKLVSAALAALILSMPAAACAEETSSVTVSASSVKTTTPDTAEVNLGISEYGEEAAEVQGVIAKKISAVKAALSDIPEDSVSVTNYYVNPQYNYDSASEDYNKIVGYNVSVSIIISDVAADEVGELITKCTEAGANNVGNVEYKCSNYEEVYASALSDAVKKAKGKAEVIAEAAGGTLGSIISISENYENAYFRRSESYDAGALKNMAAAEDSMELSPEDAEIQAGVTIEYKLE